MSKTINTVIVLRNDQTTAWEQSSYKLLKGEVGIGYLENGNVIAKLGVDGKTAWADLPQIEGVLENEITLTHDFGRYKTDAEKGFVRTTDAKDKTISQWLIHALSETKEPIIEQPTFNLTASATGTESNFGEIGTYITGLKWTGTVTYGSYEYGPETGLSEDNMTWAISNNKTSDTATTEDGEFALGESKIQLTQEASKTYATITGTYTLDATNAATPVNNVGAETAGKITDKTDTIVANVNRSAYRKPFWGWKDTASSLTNPEAITSAQIRALGNSGTSNAALPTTVKVPAGTKQVYFAAKAGTKKSLTVKNTTKEPATSVACTKVSNAVSVEGANGYTGTNYDLWYINLDAAFTGETTLSLTWA